MALLSKRIHGLSLEEAAATLEQDHAALERWLSSLGEQGDPLHFALGFFITAGPEELAKIIKEEAEKPPEPTPHLHMDLPSGAKLRRVEGGGPSDKLVTLKGLWLAMGAVSEEALQNLTKAHPHGPDRSETLVSFGEVTGRKFVFKGESWRGPYKKIGYAFKVPGGHVDASITPIGKNVDEANWDEAPFEASFHTLRVETKPPQPKPPPHLIT
jgi:hypothetical protein